MPPVPFAYLSQFDAEAASNVVPPANTTVFPESDEVFDDTPPGWPAAQALPATLNPSMTDWEEFTPS
jgi:hypothetical protein